MFSVASHHLFFMGDNNLVLWEREGRTPRKVTLNARSISHHKPVASRRAEPAHPCLRCAFLVSGCPLCYRGKEETFQTKGYIYFMSLTGSCMEGTQSTSQGENKGNNNLIRKSQHGFTKGSSCLTNDNGISGAVIKTADRGKCSFQFTWIFIQAL